MTQEQLMELGLTEEQARQVEEMGWEENRAREEAFAEKEYGYVLDRALAGVEFTSQGAKKAFGWELRKEGLALKDGEIEGFGDYLARYREKDPGAFREKGAGRLVASAPAGGEQREAAGLAALRSAFGLKD